MRFLRVGRILGTVFIVYSFFLLIPLVGSLFWDAPDAPTVSGTGGMRVTTVSFALAGLFVFLLGLVLTTLTPKVEEDLREREAYFIVGAGWMFCAVLGALPFVLTGATRSPTVALFESMSAITTTGYSALPNPLEQYAPSVHLWRGTLHFFGGMGIILILYAIIGRLTEGGVKLLGSETGGDVQRLRPTLSQTAKALFAIYLGLTVVIFGALWTAMRYAPLGLDWKTSAYHAIVHAFGTIATGGMGTLTSSVEGFHSTWVSVVVGVGMFLGGTSFLLFYQAVSGRGLGVFRDSAEFRFFVSIIAGAAIAVTVSLWLNGQDFLSSLGDAVFMVITAAATCGYTIMDTNTLPDSARLVLVFLMITGGMVGSTAGGIKVARIQVLFQMTFRELERLLHPHAVAVVKMAGHIVPDQALRRVVVFFFVYVTTFIAGALALTFLGFPISDGIVASAASLGGVGFGWGAGAGFAEPISDMARLVGIALMWLGRLEIFTVLLLFVRGTYRG